MYKAIREYNILLPDGMICCVTDPDGNVTYKSGHYYIKKDDIQAGKIHSVKDIWTFTVEKDPYY